VCERGGPSPVAANARVDKSLAVKNAGGVGMVLMNVVQNSLNADLHSIPTVHVSHTDGAAITAYVTGAGAAATARLTQGVVNNLAPAPDVAAFSSRGPSVGGGGDILKPDIMAPGQDILAAVAPPGNAGKDFDLLSGTSMSSPHVAGLGALLSQAHPEWSPAAMRSALATTADAVSRPSLTPFNAGSGHVRPNLSVDPGLIYDAGFDDYRAFLRSQRLCTLCFGAAPAAVIDPSDLNQPSIAIGDVAGTQTVTRRVTNVGKAGTYTPTVVAPAGFTVTVTPTSLELDPGETAEYKVDVVRTDAPFAAFPNTFRFGSLTWSDGTHSVRSPIVLRAVPIAAPASVSLTGASGSTTYSIRTGYAGSLAYESRGLIPAVTEQRTVVDDPTSNFATGNPDGNQGIQVHDIVVPAGTTYARFSTFDAFVDGEDDDLDLYVYRVNGDGSKTLVGTSGGGTAQEEVNLVNPAAATYKVYVHGWETDGPDAVYTLFSWVLGSADAGNMTATGPTTATVGGTGTVTLSWTGLTAGLKYLGAIAYKEGTTVHGTTIVRVDS
jgi:hypothetical protein